MTRHDDSISRSAFDCLGLRDPPDGKGPLARAGGGKLEHEYVVDPDSGEYMPVTRDQGSMWAHPSDDQARKMQQPSGTKIELVDYDESTGLAHAVDAVSGEMSEKPVRVFKIQGKPGEYVVDLDSGEALTVIRENYEGIGPTVWARPSDDQRRKMGLAPGKDIELNQDSDPRWVRPVDPSTGNASDKRGLLVKVQGESGGQANSGLVKQLQMFLVALGFDLGKTGPTKDGVDGDFGDVTEKAVKSFQDQHTDFNGEKLKTDGKFGPKTSDAVNRALVGLSNDDDIQVDVYLTPLSLTKPVVLLTTTRDGLQKNPAVIDDFGKIAKDYNKIVLTVVD